MNYLKDEKFLVDENKIKTDKGDILFRVKSMFKLWGSSKVSIPKGSILKVSPNGNKTIFVTATSSKSFLEYETSGYLLDRMPNLFNEINGKI